VIFSAILASVLLALFLFVARRGESPWVGDHRIVGGTYSMQVSKGMLNGLTVAVTTTAAVEFELAREDTFSTVGKYWGLTGEGQVLLPEFDDELFLACDDPYVVAGLRHDPELPRLLAALFEKQPGGWFVKRVVCRHGDLRADVALLVDSLNASTYVATMVSRLREVALRLDAAVGTYRRDRLRRQAAYVRAFVFALGTYAFVQGLRLAAIDSPDTLADGLLASYASVPAALLAIVAVTYALRRFAGTSRGHAVLLPLLLLGIPGGYVASLAALRDYNIERDHAPDVTLGTVVVDRHVEARPDGRSRYVITLTPWPGVRGIPLEHGVRRVDYDRLVPGSKVHATMHRGRLGIAWSDGVGLRPKWR
jgi:hypothetical protein